MTVPAGLPTGCAGAAPGNIGCSGTGTFGSVTAPTSVQSGSVNAVFYPMQCGTGAAPAWCKGVYFRKQSPGSGYVSTDTPTCSVSGGTVATAGTAATCAAVVTRAGGLWFYVTNPGSYSVLPTTVTVGGTVSGSGASASLNTVFGADVGSWSDLALGNCPVDVNGLYHCTIVNTATAARLAMNSTMHVPSGVDVECKGPALQWTPTVGTAVQLGSPHPGSSADGHSAFDCALMGPEVTAGTYNPNDTSIGMTIGGDPGAAYGGGWQAVEAGNALGVGSLVDPSAQGNGFLIRPRYVAGFHFGAQGGNNFYVDDFFVESWFRNYIALADMACNNPATNFAGQEALNIYGGQFWGNRANAIRMDCGNHWSLFGTRVDYSNNAGLSQPFDWAGTAAEGVRAANAEIYGKNVYVQCHGCHLEHASGPMVYTYQTAGKSVVRLFGGTLVPAAPIGDDTTLSACSGNGATVTFTGTFDSLMTALQGGGGTTVAISGFSGACAAFNGLTFNDTSITSTTFTANSSIVASGTSTGHAIVPLEAGYIALNKIGGSSEDVIVDGTYSTNSAGTGQALNAVTQWVDNTGDAGASVFVTNSDGQGGPYGPPKTGYYYLNPQYPPTIIDNNLSIDNHFEGSSGSTPDQVLVPSITGAYEGIATGVRQSTDSTFRLQTTLKCNGVSGQPGVSLGPGGSTATDTRLCRIAAGVLDTPGTVSAAVFVGDQTVTIAPGTAAGTGATAVCDTADGFACTNNGGVVTLVSGASPGTGEVLSITWGTAYPAKPVCVWSSVIATPLIAANVGYWPLASQTTTKAVLGVSSAISGTYKIVYRCGL
jgi:hypothetical protein